MAKKRRIPLQVSPVFWQKLNDMQIKIRTSGKNKSFRDLTEEIVNSKFFADIEKNILKNDIGLLGDIQIRMDIRRKI